MGNGTPSQAIRQTLLRLHGADSLSDAALLERFASERDEAAFGVLVRRHGPMVLGVCRRILNDAHLAEDAFQAAFVVVARKAAMLAQPHFANGSIAGWLHKVALQIAGRARRGSIRRSTHEKPLGDCAAVSASTHENEMLTRDLRPVLDEELSK
ncbi:MAG: RNA polymerase sigma factor, partial [Gemmataceae bacterium]